MTVTLPVEDVEAAERAVELLVPVWSQLLAQSAKRRPLPLSPTAKQWIVEDVLHSIVSTVVEYPGAGLTFYECEGRCGLLVWDAPTDDRLTLCDSCRDEASHATEEYLLALVRHREADDDEGPRNVRPTRLADVLSEKLRARIDLIEDETVDVGQVRIIDNLRPLYVSIDEHPNAFGETLTVVGEEDPR